MHSCLILKLGRQAVTVAISAPFLWAWDTPKDFWFWERWQKESPRGQCVHRFQPSKARQGFMAAQVIVKATGDPRIWEAKFTIWSCSLGGAEFSSLEGLRSREKPGDTAKNWTRVILKASTTGLLEAGHRNYLTCSFTFARGLLVFLFITFYISCFWNPCRTVIHLLVYCR